MRALLAVNVHSRRGREAAGLVRAELAAHGVEVLSEDPGPGAALDAVVGVGGDGTLVHLVPFAIERGAPLGIVPVGTFNELARTLGIPADVHAACAVIAAGRTRSIDVGRVNGVHYFSEASVGISSRAAALQTPGEKRRFGFLAIIASFFGALRHSRPMRVEVEFDGRTESFMTVQLTVANSHRFGGFFNVGDAAIDDGWLDLYSIEIHNVVEAFTVAWAMIVGRRESVPGLRTYRAARFSIRTRRQHRIRADGEPAGTTPAVFEVLPNAVRVFVPEPDANRR